MANGPEDFASVREALGGKDLREQLRWMEENPPDLPDGDGAGDGDPRARCERCGGLVRDDAPIEGAHCRCDGALKRCRETVEAADTGSTAGASMTFDDLDTSDPGVARAAAAARRVATGGQRGLAMFGEPGTGKTHTALAACRLALQRRSTAAYYNMVELVSLVQKTYGAPWYEESRSDVLRRVAGRELIVVDDLGKERDSEDVRTIVFELFHGLYSSGSRLILCSNLGDAEYRDRYDGAVTSRIAFMCEIVVVAGEDRRRSG